ncbi:MAG TPA: hypothetical protein VMD55_13245, partial [Terracidiphilus sp.]|nr:hypothetical protein [Terracidiphilus sp.]
MKLIPVRTGRRAMLSVLSLSVLAFTLPALMQRAAAQDKPDEDQPANAGQSAAGQNPAAASYRTIYLTNVTSDRDANEIVTDLRNMLPRARLY